MSKKSDQPINITITSGTIVKTILIFLGLYLLFVMRDLVLVILTAIVIASAIEPGTRWLVSKKFPRVASVFIIYALIVAIFVGVFAVFLPPLVDDVRQMARQFPQYVESVTSSAQINNVPGLETFVGTITDGSLTSDIISQISSTFSGATVGVLTTASSIFGGLLSFVLIVVISFYLAVQEKGVENFIRIITPVNQEKYVIDLWRRSQRKIGLWMQGQLILALIVGIMTFLGLSILGVPNATFLALIAAMFELIPIFGPILAAIPAVGFALIGGDLTLGLLTAGLYVIIQQFESQLIHPLVVRKIVGIPALIAIIALIIGATIAGFLGVIISVPIAAAVMEFLGDVEKKKKEEIEALAIAKK